MTRLLAYLDRLDKPDFLKGSDPWTWWSGAALMVLLVVAGTWLPLTSRFVQLSPWGPLLVTGGWILLTVPAGSLLRSSGNSRRFRALIVFGSAWLELFLVVLVLSAGTWPARYLFGLFLLFSMAAHGRVLRVTPDAPYLPVLGLFLGGMAALLSPSREASTFLVLVLLCGLYVMFVYGRNQLATDLVEQQLANEREALSATLLAQAHSSAAQLERRHMELLGAHHDARNLLATALLKSDLLYRKFQQPAPAPATHEVTDVLHRVREALTLAAGLFQDSTRPRSPVDAFPVRPILDRLADDFRLRWPMVQLAVHLPGHVSVNLPGGATTLRRVVENILINAAEGRGRHRASSVRLDLAVEEGRLHLRTADNGPGFPVEVLAGSRERFTTKKGGSGLGLLTVDSLVRACNGTLALSNRPEGGAQVDIFLPLAAPHRPEEEAASA